MKNNLFLVVSDNDKIIDYNIYNILKNIDFDDNNKILYDLSINTLSDVLDEASMISMFSSVKVIISKKLCIDNIREYDIEYLNKYVQNINKDVYMIFITDKVDARKKSFKCFKDNFKIIEANPSKGYEESNIFNFVKTYINDNNFKIDNSNINYFVMKTGNDINNIKSELDKIFIYKNDDKFIKRDDIDLLVVDNIENVIYEFTNAIYDKNYDKISTMYDKFLFEDIGNDYLIAAMANSFKSSLIIKKYYNQGKSNAEIAKILGKKEFYVLKTLERLTEYTEVDLENMIVNLAKIDRNLKTGIYKGDELKLFLFCKEDWL